MPQGNSDASTLMISSGACRTASLRVRDRRFHVFERRSSKGKSVAPSKRQSKGFREAPKCLRSRNFWRASLPLRSADATSFRNQQLSLALVGERGDPDEDVSTTRAEVSGFSGSMRIDETSTASTEISEDARDNRPYRPVCTSIFRRCPEICRSQKDHSMLSHSIARVSRSVNETLVTRSVL